MPVIERQFSEFLRQPNDVIADLDEHDVVLRRRNAPALRLSFLADENDRSEALVALGRLLRHLAVHSGSAFEVALRESFVWSDFLPTHDRRQFVDELTRTLAASADIDNFAPVTQLLREWRSTAEIYADPKLARRLRRAITASGPDVAIPAA